jgi:hypothetical protein
MGSPDADVYDALAGAFASLGVRWFVFGAQAAIVHGALRFTEDIDVTADLGDKPTSALVRVLEDNGFSLRVEDVDGFVDKTRVVPLLHEATGFPVDVVLSGPGLEELFFARAQSVDVGGRPVPFASAEDIIVMKVLAGRAKDLEDVVAIVAAQKDKLAVSQIRDTLELIEQALDQSDLRPVFEQCFERAMR